MDDDRFNLQHFVDAQDAPYFAGSDLSIYDGALKELRAGAKTGHWIWFIFPQLAGLGHSHRSKFYGLSGIDEARAYLAHPVLGPRLRASVAEMLAHNDQPAANILGALDATKFRSSLTLFARAAPNEPLFQKALAQFYNGAKDPRTLQLLDTMS